MLLLPYKNTFLLMYFVLIIGLFLQLLCNINSSCHQGRNNHELSVPPSSLISIISSGPAHPDLHQPLKLSLCWWTAPSPGGFPTVMHCPLVLSPVGVALTPGTCWGRSLFSDWWGVTSPPLPVCRSGSQSFKRFTFPEFRAGLPVLMSVLWGISSARSSGCDGQPAANPNL